MLSLIIPVYKNESGLDKLIEVLEGMSVDSLRLYQQKLEVVFVVDGSPDRCYENLKERLDNFSFNCQLISHSRNFGSFAGIRTGLSHANGNFLAVMAADLQEPPSLILEFFGMLLTEDVDVVVGSRSARNDPYFSRLSANIFWRLYRFFVNSEIPEGGVDIFGCNRAFADKLLSLRESNSSLIGLIYWLGFRRKEVQYVRQVRQYGVSSWSFTKKLNYMLDSLFAFTDLPIKVLIACGLVGLTTSVLLGGATLVAKLLGSIDLPGYTTIVIFTTFFGGLNALGLGIVGNYAWRAYENTKMRPLSLIGSHISNQKTSHRP